MKTIKYKYRVSVLFKDGAKINGRANKSIETIRKRKISALNDSTVKQAWVEYADYNKKNWNSFTE